MKKKYALVLAAVLSVAMLLSGCSGSSPVADSYEFLSYNVPDGYVRDGSHSYPVYRDGSDYPISITIESPDDEATVDQMLEWRLDPSPVDGDEFVRLDDYIIDGISCANYFNYYADSNICFGNVAFIHDGQLVTLTISGIGNDIPEDVSAMFFHDFCDSVRITDK